MWHCTVGDTRWHKTEMLVHALPADWIIAIHCCMELLNKSLSDRCCCTKCFEQSMPDSVRDSSLSENFFTKRLKSFMIKRIWHLWHLIGAFKWTTGCLQLLEILEISWNLNGPPGNFCVMIENWLMALLHDDVALFVHWRMQYKNVVNVIVGWIAQWWALVGAHHHMLH